jgi:YlmC/YmxH family sporulation protein
MELTFSELRQKEVINIADGRRLGRISDLVFMYPKCILTGLVVPGCHRVGLFRSAPELFISMSCITKIGEDVILVNLKKATGNSGPCCGSGPSYSGSLYTSESLENEVSSKVQNLKDNMDDFE